MPSFKVKVKWQKSNFDVEVDTDESPLLFKAQLFDLTGVSIDRQKVFLKGATLKDDSWGSLAVKDGVNFLMMGSKEEEIPKEPAATVLFAEDMDANTFNKALDLPGGLKNLGNTCYLNATLQCILGVPEFKEALIQLPRAAQLSSGAAAGVRLSEHEIFLGQALRDVMKGLASGQTQAPFVLLQTVHQVFPQFSQRNEQGVLMQQDANECWTELIALLKRLMPTLGPEQKINVIEKYLRGTFESVHKNKENAEEPAQKSEEIFYQLSCFINQDVKYLESGLRSRLLETMTKRSPTLERDATYTKESKISRLPGYLSIQFVRFFYKEREAVNAKILKDVKFPMVLDLFELCTPELQQKLIPMRERYKAEDDRQAMDKAKKMGSVAPPSASKPVSSLSAGQETSDAPVRVSTSFPDDEGSNNSGFYELIGVLTHQGRSSSSGHYLAWVRHKGDIWLKFDDDDVSAVTKEDILRLSGGGDWHCAYVLVYGPRPALFHPEKKEEQTPPTEATPSNTASAAMETSK